MDRCAEFQTATLHQQHQLVREFRSIVYHYDVNPLTHHPIIHYKVLWPHEKHFLFISISCQMHHRGHEIWNLAEKQF